MAHIHQIAMRGKKSTYNLLLPLSSPNLFDLWKAKSILLEALGIHWSSVIYIGNENHE
jgi:hypothetical protein